MLRKEDFAVIKALKKRDVYVKDIAAELGVHPKTVSRALQRGSAPSAGGRRGTSKLDPYKPTIDRLLGEGVWNAMVILREIKAEGYPGGMTILRQYVGPKRALRPSRATVRFEPIAGQATAERLGCAHRAHRREAHQGALPGERTGLLPALSPVVHRPGGRRAYL